jgi:hypothetical protein
MAAAIIADGGGGPWFHFASSSCRTRRATRVRAEALYPKNKPARKAAQRRQHR